MLCGCGSNAVSEQSSFAVENCLRAPHSLLDAKGTGGDPHAGSCRRELHLGRGLCRDD